MLGLNHWLYQAGRAVTRDAWRVTLGVEIAQTYSERRRAHAVGGAGCASPVGMVAYTPCCQYLVTSNLSQTVYIDQSRAHQHTVPVLSHHRFNSRVDQRGSPISMLAPPATGFGPVCGESHACCLSFAWRSARAAPALS